MRISVELSLYPLREDYFVPIEDFLTHLRAHKEVTIRTNGMSTQIFGEYQDVMRVLNQELERSMSGKDRLVFVAKFLNTDVSEFKERC